MILRYLKGTSNYGIQLKKNKHLNVTGFADVDWSTDLDDEDQQHVVAYTLVITKCHGVQRNSDNI